ncbi:MAG TPA: KH domain-containing protein [Vicinamibacterales bacterium]
MSASDAGGGNAGGSPLRTVVEVVVRALVDHPDAVRVTEVQRRGMTVLELTTAPGDMGKIIGRQGRTAGALRTLVALTAEKHGTRAQLDIRD